MIVLLLACAPEPAFPDPAQELLDQLDADGSGALTLEELRAPNPWRMMKILDRDTNSRIDLDELRADLDRWPVQSGAGMNHGVRRGGKQGG